MVAVVATFTVAEGDNEAFEKEFAVLRDAVRDNEPGNRLFLLTRPKKGPQTYKILEVYESRDDFRSHSGSTWFQSSFERLKATFAADPVIEVLELVA